MSSGYESNFKKMTDIGDHRREIAKLEEIIQNETFIINLLNEEKTRHQQAIANLERDEELTQVLIPLKSLSHDQLIRLLEMSDDPDTIKQIQGMIHVKS